MKTKPLFIVMSAPSGCGKSTLIDMLLQEYSDIVYSISCTTREPRGEEEDGLDYHFKTKERFEELIKKNAFIEYAKVHDNYYGTLKGPIEEVLAEGNSMILDIDVQGAAALKAIYPEATLIFIAPPSRAELERRLRERKTDDPAEIAKRLRNAAGEIFEAEHFDYVVVNDELARATGELLAILNGGYTPKVAAGLVLARLKRDFQNEPALP